MGILTLDQRLGGIALAVLDAPLRGTVHRADDVGVVIIVSPLVLHRPGGVIGLDPVVTGHEVRAVSSLVAKAPDNHGRMVDVPEDHPAIPDQMGGLEILPLGESGLTVAHTMRLDIAFVNDIEAVFVTQGVPERVVGIVACTHSVDIQLFHDPDIPDHVSL